MPSKVFGPTDSVADTVTKIGSTYTLPPGNWTIDKVWVGKGNVVNAAQNSGFLLIQTATRTYAFAYGNGTGGATNSNNITAEPIDVPGININGGADLEIYVLDATAAKDVTVEVDFKSGGGGMNDAFTLCGGGVSANGDTVADTAEDFTISTKLTPYKLSLTPHRRGRIRQIRYAGSSIIDAKATTAKVTLNIPGAKDPYEFVFGYGSSGAATSGPAHADVRNVDIEIPAQALPITIVSAENLKSPHISLTVQ